MNSLIIWAGFLGSILGITTSLLGGIAFYRGSVIKGYAAQRDYEHLKKKYESLAEAFKFQTDVFEDEFKRTNQINDNRFDRIDKDLTEIKALLLANLRLRNPLKEDD